MPTCWGMRNFQISQGSRVCKKKVDLLQQTELSCGTNPSGRQIREIFLLCRHLTTKGGLWRMRQDIGLGYDTYGVMGIVPMILSQIHRLPAAQVKAAR